MPGKDPLIYVMHIRDCCARIVTYTAETASWLGSPIVLDAVCRNITVIGEAARKIDTEFHGRHPEIPWSGLIGARNIVMHAYDFVKPELIQQMVEQDIPELLANCRRILGEGE